MESFQLQSLNESDPSMPFPFLVENHCLHPQFSASSPSPDMEAAIERFGSREDSTLSSSCNSFEVADILMDDTFLDYVNEILMAEEQEESLPAGDDAQASYHALMKSFYDIIAEPLPPDSISFDSSSLSVSCPIDSWLTSCDGETDIQKIKAFDDLGSFNNCRELSALEGCGSLEHQDTPESLKSGTSLDISFEDLKVQADYASLYVGKLSLEDTTSNEGKAISRNGGSRSHSRAVRKRTQCKQGDGSLVACFVDLKDLLVTCAQAVAMGDVRRATQILHDLYNVHGVSLQGNSLQRVAHYFCEALVARMTGMGGHQYRIMCENRPSVVSCLKASRIWYQMTPQFKMMHYFANQSILKVAEGAARLHILDFHEFHGMQWPCLINALADRREGPPSLVITGIEDSHAGKNCLEMLKETGQRLASYAKRYNVPFQFHPFVSENWENIDPASLQLCEGEVLVVNRVKRLGHLLDVSVDPLSTISPRQKLLMRIRNLNPHLLLMADTNSAYGSSFFVSRFREALHCFFNKQDMLDTVCSDDPYRLFVEQRHFSSCILNIVACEGVERVERPEPFKQLDLRLRRAGFALLDISSDVLSRAKLYMKQHYHSDFMLDNEGKGWLLLGWKGRTLQAMSAWKPCHVVS